jgi:hypothetical protein
MPSNGPVLLFYDRDCGVCSFWARITHGMARTPLQIEPLDGPIADTVLAPLAPTDRNRAFHIHDREGTHTGAEALPQWIGLVAGKDAEHVVERVSPVRRSLEWIYTRFWRYRLTRGCAVGTRIGDP